MPQMTSVLRQAGGAKFPSSLGAYGTIGVAQSFQNFSIPIPDSAQHDVSKECILVRRVTVLLAHSNLVDILGQASEVGEMFIGWRSGNFASDSVSPSLTKYLRVGSACIQNAAAITQRTNQPGFVFEVIYDEPIPSSPTFLSIGEDIDDSGGTMSFPLNSVVFAGAEYSWTKATSDHLLSYMTWEALGA